MTVKICDNCNKRADKTLLHTVKIPAYVTGNSSIFHRWNKLELCSDCLKSLVGSVKITKKQI